MTRWAYVAVVAVIGTLAVLHAIARDPNFFEDVGVIAMATGYRRYVVRTEKIRRQVLVESERLAARLDRLTGVGPAGGVGR